jgi:hypothetical protein
MLVFVKEQLERDGLAPHDYDVQIRVPPKKGDRLFAKSTVNKKGGAAYFDLDYQLNTIKMSSEGPYGRQGFQSNPSGYGSGGGGASYGGGEGGGGGYSAPQYGGGYGAGSYAAPSPQAGSYGGDTYSPYGAQIPGDYQVCNESKNVGRDCCCHGHPNQSGRAYDK